MKKILSVKKNEKVFFFFTSFIILRASVGERTKGGIYMSMCSCVCVFEKETE